jgi:hypothetical protein
MNIHGQADHLHLLCIYTLFLILYPLALGSLFLLPSELLVLKNNLNGLPWTLDDGKCHRKGTGSLCTSRLPSRRTNPRQRQRFSAYHEMSKMAYQRQMTSFTMKCFHVTEAGEIFLLFVFLRVYLVTKTWWVVRVPSILSLTLAMSKTWVDEQTILPWRRETPHGIKHLVPEPYIMHRRSAELALI